MEFAFLFADRPGKPAWVRLGSLAFAAALPAGWALPSPPRAEDGAPGAEPRPLA